MATITNVTPAARQLTGLKIVFKLHAFDYAHEGGSIGQAAADAMGMDPARVLKTLILVTDSGSFAMALLRVDAELDLKAAASALHVKKATMAEVRTAERLTGYIKGGISPVGQKRKLPALIDREALGQPTVFISAGKRGLEIEIGPQILTKVLDARPYDLRR